MEKPLQYSLNIQFYTAGVKTEGDGVALLDDRNLILAINGSHTKSIPYVEILGIHDEDYVVDLYCASGESIKLTQLGYEYENFLLNLFKRRGELLLRYMLMDEKKIAYDIDTHFLYVDEDGDQQKGDCEFRVYESAILVLPQKGEPIRVPLCYIENHSIADYVVTIASDSGERLVLSMIGEKTDYLMKSLVRALSEMVGRVKRLLIEAAPNIDQGKISEAAALLGDGRAASKQQIEAISPELWSLLEKRLKETGLGEEYTYLTRLSKQEVWVGLKRGLMGERTGEYTWFMTPIYDPDPTRPGNAIALEAASDESAGRATYFFRMMSRPVYNVGINLDDLIMEAEKFVLKANRCMIEINFRREPIYLPVERLATPEYERYLYAANKLSSLKLLRERYIGRVAHVNQEQWMKDTGDLLKFNVESREDSDRWR